MRGEYLLQDGVRKADTVAFQTKRIKYLLTVSDLFKHFIDSRAQIDPEFANIVRSVENSLGSRSKAGGNAADHRHRKTEKEEDAELLIAEDEEEQTIVFTESPAYVHGKLRDYQVQGLNWMISLYENNISGILADEMGLGKTLQTISFLGYMRYVKGIAGPHLIIVPKSTLDNWAREFAKWTPEVQVLVLQGDKESRAVLIKDRLMKCDFDVVVTSYEMVLKEKGYLKRFAWQYIAIDEAHRIKNEDSMLSQIIRMFSSKNRLLITGTPLQNNLHELWALLNFILPDIFSSSATFDEWFESQGEDQEKKDSVIKQLHSVLRPFLLRRIKADVEKSLLPKKEVNIYILEKDIGAVNGQVRKGEKTRLLNIVMQLRKCCNHPYLFDGAEPGPPYTTDEHLVFNSAKLKIIDKLLKQLKEKGSRVLIFSQMSRLLDILEDYCVFRDYKYCRIDGQTAHEDRISAIDNYNAPDSDKFVFLLTTRAGGLGINLTTADTVILYDSDWNPQADLQAMDRAHRIGQKKQVVVFRFVTENAIEEKVLERATQKLRLDQLVIQQGRARSSAQTTANNKDELVSMIQYGADKIFNGDKESEANGKISEDINIEEILRKGEEKTAELNSRYEKLGLDDLQKFTSDSAYEWNGEDFTKKNKDKKGALGGQIWIQPTKRERKENYSIDGYYRDVMNSSKDKKDEPKAPRPPKQINIQDHQFYPQRLVEIQDKETSYYRKQIDYKVPLAEGAEEDSEAREANRQLEQEEINSAEPLTEQEEEEKKELASQGFANWSRRDFTKFVQECAKYGRDNIEGIALEFDDKSLEDVAKYTKVFWQKYTEIDGYDRYIAQIEAGEEKSRKIAHQKDVLKQKVELCTTPMQTLSITYPPGHNKKIYTEEEDRYLLIQMNRFGLDSENLYEKIREAIRASPIFRFDWFFLSRTSVEIARRCQTLLTCIVREVGGPGSAKRKYNKEGGIEGAENSDAEDAETGQSGVSTRANTPSRTSNGSKTPAGRRGSKKAKTATPVLV
ncbi:hypothetical protein NADFUDRAFT_58324 [Nadsonia fulvescens var. elongata DSM 6958]|uniref:Chromatin remodelling complex ATPase chain ISW1 n=1 Tax=Nadsonia fulvescens var. elongata DSM 6958 TaxID=857566 RepID=A0A1E3PLE4_9ASCO|nr:hypothetical protein NADFUDRAFT_58324 [Nadsonia fulvescens var. elongata DSM 6958]